ncbi:MAG: acylase [Burkholderiaceae bacterium]|nr:acylase [Burkholderiaceae bacterium]
MLRRVGKSVLIVVVLALVALFAANTWRQRERVSQQELITHAQAYDARIVRDSWGVPHIFGTRDADVAFGFAYAHAEDDYATIQDVAIAVRGHLAAVRGPDAAPGDYLVNLLHIWDDVDARYTSDIPADARAVMDAYADGLNLYAARHPDQVVPGVLPYTGRDVAAGFLFKLPFFYGFDRTLKQIFSGKSELPRTPTGSNGAAVAPSRSNDGATRLLVNSHQPYTGPVAWYEAVLQSGEGWHVAGGFFPGAPFMLHGHNEHLGWANTVNAPDLVDVFKLTVNPDNANQYRLDGQWRDFDKTTAWLWVKLWGPLVVPIPKTVWHSAHGPVLRTDHGDFALRYAGMDEVRAGLQVYRLNKAHSLEEWKAAMALQAVPSLNYIYADEKGNIGYLYNGLFAQRPAGFEKLPLLAGDRSDLIWHGYLPLERAPQLWNPPSGLVFNSNCTPYHASEAADNLKPEDFPKSMGIQTNMTNRARRFEETFGQDRAISAESFRRYKYDLMYSADSALYAVVRQMLALPANNDAELQAAQAQLQQWNRSTDMHNRSAALALLAAVPVVRAHDEGTPAPELRTALLDAAHSLQQHFHRLDPEWGEVNRIVRGKADLAIDGAHDTLRAVWGEAQADGHLHGVAGDTLIMFVEWDKQGRLSSESIHQFGSATLDAASPHYADQLPLFVAMQTKPVWFTEQQLAGHIEREYRVGKNADLQRQ